MIFKIVGWKQIIVIFNSDVIDNVSGLVDVMVLIFLQKYGYLFYCFQIEYDVNYLFFYLFYILFGFFVYDIQINKYKSNYNIKFFIDDLFILII